MHSCKNENPTGTGTNGMFNKILIANRGEIACRIARTARQLGIATIAIYSEADRHALHVQSCDQAFCVGAAAASESYLDGDKIIKIALQYGAEAIHPGYGFLSENAKFAKNCEQSGLVFIGPPASAIEAMGSKIEAKRLMQGAGVPLIPGYHGDDQSDETLKAESARIGYPQLIKASAGGGGKGMRVVRRAEEFNDSLISARREALASFADDRVLLERYLTQPRHVELQVFADTKGHAVHLFERDCSIQRRHQKVLEEAPAPGMTKELRDKMGQTAIDCARAIDYVGAGTVEFLLDEDGSFYFMEMNTRLQVEHPVSEMITGQDLVQWQLEVACGLELPLQQADISLVGHAIEARIYAENPDNGFLPSTGKLHYLVTPEPNGQLRIDSGIQQGDEIGVHYDPMIAKLIVHADDRLTAIAKLRHALAAYRVFGVQTNIGFLHQLLSIEEFAQEQFDTGFIEKHEAELFSAETSPPHQVILLSALYMLLKRWQGDPRYQQLNDPCSPWNLCHGWRMNQSSYLSLKFSDDIKEYRVDASQNGQQWVFNFDGVEYQVDGKLIEETLLQAEIEQQKFTLPVIERDQQISLWFKQKQWNFNRVDFARAYFSSDASTDELVSPMPGYVIDVKVTIGDEVKSGDALVIVEAMKMEHSIIAPADATVQEIFFQEGDQVEEGDRLVRLE